MTSVFINPRSLISSSNVDTLLLKSALPESRLTFVNAGSAQGNYQSVASPYLAGKNLLLQPVNQSGTPVFSISSIGNDFSFLQNNVKMANFSTNNLGISTYFNVYGAIRASNIALVTGTESRKGIILSDNNPTSAHQFSGIGYTYGVANYQVPTRNAIHAFYAASSANNSKEWMRIQENTFGNAQLGIGTSIFSSNVALEVAGNVNIRGSITVSDGFYGFVDTSSFVTLNSNTGRISSNVMPEKLVYLNTDNQIDTSLLNQTYNFQYLKSQKNVGIGVKNPVQKFQVLGTAAFSDRIAIGLVYPAARIHAIESAAVIPTMILENNRSGDLLQSKLSGAPAVYFSGTHPGIGIGTSNIPMDTAMNVIGNVVVKGNLSCCNINLEYVSGKTINITDPSYGPILKLETVTNTDNTTGLVLRCSVPFQSYSTITVDRISSTQSDVRIYNSSLIVDNNLYLSVSPIITSDERLKTEITPITNALEKLEKIHGYTFRHKYSYQKAGGVIAQEINTILPEAVKTLSTGYYGVQYDALIGLLIEAIHELKEKLDQKNNTQL